MDILVQEPTFPSCLVETLPIGGLDMADEKGGNFKVLADPVGDPRFSHVRSLEQLDEHWLREIETFFSTYKLFEPKQTEVLGWHSEAETRQVIARCREQYRAASEAEKRELST